MIYILGIHDGHNCGATLTGNGVVLASVSEERLTRQKNAVGYPVLAIEEVLRLAGVAPGELTDVVYASEFMHKGDYLTNLEPWYRVGLQDQLKADQQQADYQRAILVERKRERTAAVSDHLDIDPAKVSFLEHHLCHLAGAYYSAPNVQSGKPVLGLTCDGAGDNLAGTVSSCVGNSIERLAVINRHASLGKIYSRITMLMGMTPWEHEYKLMGLAPYADPARSDAAAEPLRQLLHVAEGDMQFTQSGKLSMNFCYEYLRDCFENVRFDVIAGAAQLFTEEVLTAWVRDCVRKTGISDIVCGGGVFMNVKANMLIAQLPEVTSMYVMPSAGDESLSIGACLHRYYQESGNTDHSDSILENLYLGAEHDRRSEESAITEELGGADVDVSESDDIDLQIADLLAEGETVARCRGRMEWGARALGNRSILASAENYARVDEINRAIKQRDFWMPFAPSIREESAGRYIDDQKNLRPNFMTFAFPTKPEGYNDLVAASHPRDATIRPQIVTQKANPGYHKLITRFEERTGRGVVLNTSFNLHGYPIVDTPTDAIRVFVNSGLENLALNHFMLRKAPRGAAG
jgi:carbamoyltransferase